jgi:DNA (cytosine-5)-methyltransferase 1
LANAIDEQRAAAGKPPAIIVCENVPGVLSTKDNAFGCFLAGLAGEDVPLVAPGGKWTNAGAVFGPARAVAWRILDAQYFGVAQRRRRVFVVASARDGFDPCEVLFERDGVRRDTAPSRETGQGATKDAGSGFTASSFGAYQAGVGTIRAQGGDLGGGSETLTVQPAGCYWDGGQLTQTLDAVLHKGQTMPEKNRFPAVLQPAVCATGEVTHTLKADGFDGSEDGTGRGQPIVAQPTLAVRRLTPRECERLQGFPDDHTMVPYRGKPAVDGPRYKALGNSMAVPVMRWIGRRIASQLSVLEGDNDIQQEDIFG